MLDATSPHGIRFASAVCILTLTVGLPFGGWGVVSALAEEDGSTAPAAEEPELEGEAKKRHEREVKELLRQLKTEKNQEIVLGKLKELGNQPSRVARDALMEYAAGQKNHEFLDAAFTSLAKIGGKKAVDFLCSKEGLRSRNFLVAYNAAGALAEAKDVRAIGPLLDVMTAKSTKIKVVSACAEALAKTGAHDEKAVETLFEYSHHKKDTIRAYVVEALGWLTTDEAVARLTEALAEDKNTRVREYAAKGLGHTKRTDVLPVLRQALDEQTAHTVRTACMESLREIQGS